MRHTNFSAKVVLIAAVLAIISVVLVPTFVWADVEYSITKIDGLTTTGYAYPNAINNLGQVVGYSPNSSWRTRGFFWQSGTITEISTFCDPSLTDTFSEAFDINDSGVVVGCASTTVVINGCRLMHASKWISGTLTDLTPTYTNENSEAHGINSSGTIVGWRTNYLSYHSPLKWDGTTMTVLGTMTGISPDTINDLGRIVANRWIYANGQYYTLPTFNGTDTMSPTKINIAGQIVGRLPANVYNNEHAFMWKPDYQNQNTGTLYNLGDFDTNQSTYSEACDINSWGTVVGTATSTSSGYRAFIWKDCTGMIDLNTLIPTNSGWILRWANGINDKGQIICWGTYNGSSAGCILNPI